MRRWGPDNARRIRQRLAELRAAGTLADMFLLPAARCYALRGDRQGQFAVDGKHPFRLIFEPTDDPVPRKADGGVDLDAVTSIRVVDVVDYHGD